MMWWVGAIASLWCVVGMWGYIHWWITDYDFTTEDVPMLVVGAVLGPWSWVVGWMIHGPDTGKRVIIRKRDAEISRSFESPEQ